VLLARAATVLQRRDVSRLGLAVSHANRARALYQRFGFADIDESWAVMIWPA
jgi:ribosomal protein S18 acetylase RimI-like enzyme